MEGFNLKIVSIRKELSTVIEEWTPRLIHLNKDLISQKRNSQGRNIRQIVGHMIDSASNNSHRVIHLQYRESPVDFPDYANLGVNDIWIDIQKYEDEDWENLVLLWKYIHLHFLHIIRNTDISKLENIWISATGEKISMEEMILDFPRHFQLHISELKDLINNTL